MSYSDYTDYTSYESETSSASSDEGDYEYDAESGGGSVRTRSIGKSTKGLSARAPPVDVAFKGVTYEVDVPKSSQKKSGGAAETDSVLKILKGCNGRLEAGTMTALIGASGAGKSTLLNFLSGRLIGGRPGGEMTINGATATPALFRQVSEFVVQDDIVPDLLTPKETFTYAAQLRLPEISAAEREAQVDELLRDLGLWHRRNTITGTPGLLRGLSGGERKRVSIGMSMISEASLLMLDEPTSGLDSHTAFSVMSRVKELTTKRGMTVLSTIHQPSVDTLNLFDQVVILAGGLIVFAGPPDEIADHFDELGFPCAEHDNPADHALRLLSTGGAKDRKANRRIAEIIASRDKSAPDMGSSHKAFAQSNRSRHAGMFAELKTLVSRNFKVQFRNPMLTQARAAQTILFGLLLGFIFFQVGDGQSSVQGRQGALFICCAQMLFSSLIGVLFTFPAERALFIRERSDGIYRTLTYYMAKVAADVPYQIIFPIIFSSIVYWMIGFQSDFGKFVVYALVSVLLSIVGSALGFFISGATGDVQLSLSIAPGIIMPCLLLSGFLANLESMTAALSWISYINPVKYAFAAVGLNEFRGLTFACNAEDTSTCVWKTGEQVIANLDLERDFTHVEYNIICLIVVAFTLRVLGYFALLISTRKRIPH